MSRHRSFTLRNFVRSIPLDLLQRYFDEALPGQLRLEDFVSQQQGSQASMFTVLDSEALEEFLDQPEQAETKARLIADLQRINDITSDEAPDGSSLVIQAGSEWNPNIRWGWRYKFWACNYF